RGEELDTRTDLFSLGTVLYQMATGKLPFEGATSAVVFHAILQLDPVPVPQLNQAVPAKLQEIVEKLLEKDRDLRYQSAADLRGDLKRLKRDVESGRKIPGAPSGSQSVAVATASPTQLSGASVQSPPLSSVASSAPAVPVSRRWALMGVIALLALIVIGDRVRAFLRHHNELPFNNFSVTKVTEDGNVVFAALSPDGKYILSMVRDKGLASLSLRNVPTNSVTQVQPPADVGYGGLRFSPDGNYFYFVRSDPGNPELKFLYRAPLLGGTPEKLASDVDSNISFSPDGRKIAFMRYDNPTPGQYQLIVRSLEQNTESVLISGPTAQNIFQPAWSPDGKTMVCVSIEKGNALTGLLVIDTNSGQMHSLVSSHDNLYAPTWMPNGEGLLALDWDQASNFTRSQIVFVSYPDGKMSPVTRDTNSYSDLSVAASGRVLATVQSEARWNLYVMSASGSGADARALTPVSSDTNFTWTHDGRLIEDHDNKLSWVSPDTGAVSTFMNEAGSVTGDPWECPDQRHLVFVLIDQGGAGIGRADFAGGNVKHLTNDKQDNYPVCSPDSQWVYYKAGGTAHLNKVPIDGGPAQQVSPLEMGAGYFDISLDGKTAAFATVDHANGHQERLVFVDLSTGQVRQAVNFERPHLALMRFTRDGKSLVYAFREEGVDNLWQQPLDGSKGKQITNFNSEHIWDFHWSPDGSKLAIGRGHNDADVVLLRDQQQ
ncbi:MAG TPA: hypothetical protein VMD76_09240, partial [Candidatus Sulfotelmatobacter sp.]|nr:hypothetical protein [Candidatus Sulfotelmatobacter sp.]